MLNFGIPFMRKDINRLRRAISPINLLKELQWKTKLQRQTHY